MEFFKDQAEFETAVAAIVTKIMADKEAAEKEAAEKKAQEAAQGSSQPTLKEVLDRLEALGTSVASLASKQEELRGTLTSDPAGTEELHGKVPDEKGKKPSVFAGMLMKRQMQ